jgi:leader peptidase (prepilin peptidase)/N-methyltransferase
METMTLAFVVAFGAIIGSFLNVCIARLPDGRSVVRPPSHCPKCQTFLAWYENIPIVSYLFLTGRCRTCRVRISAIYPAVEVLTGALAVALFLRLGPTLAFAGYFAFAAALVVITFIDLDHQIIPDVISLPGIAIGLAFSLVSPLVTPLDAAIGVLAGGGTLLSVAWLYKTFRGQEGMGGGDIKLLAMIGAFLGWQSIFVTLFVGSVIGSIIGVVVMLYEGADSKLAIPFGPFLAGGALVYLFWGDRILAFYFGS